MVENHELTCMACGKNEQLHLQTLEITTCGSCNTSHLLSVIDEHVPTGIQGTHILNQVIANQNYGGPMPSLRNELLECMRDSVPGETDSSKVDKILLVIGKYAKEDKQHG